MRIAIHTAFLQSDHKYRGIGVYTSHLIDALNKYASVGRQYGIIDSHHTSVSDFDIVHYPYFDPFFLTLPIYAPKPTVVTVHDLIPILYPKQFPKGVKGSIVWEIQKYTLGKKQRIITDSHCSKKDIVRLTGIPNDRIDVVYLAPVLTKVTDKKSLSGESYRTGDKYFLYVGDVNWNKNVIGLLEAFAGFIHKVPQGSAYRLVLVGKACKDHLLSETQHINAHCHRLHIDPQVIRTGYISDAILAGLYSHALALIQPSWYEGFGLPVLDAMALGCPVISSNTSSLSEIAGPSLMVNPGKTDEILSAMETIAFQSPQKRQEMTAKGLAWVRQFTWKRVAKETVETYEKVLANV